MVKTSDLQLVLNALATLVLLPYGWVFCIDDGLFAIIIKILFDPYLAYIAVHRGQELYWPPVELGNHFFLYGWCKGDVRRMTYKQVHERK